MVMFHIHIIDDRDEQEEKRNEYLKKGATLLHMNTQGFTLGYKGVNVMIIDFDMGEKPDMWACGLQVNKMLIDEDISDYALLWWMGRIRGENPLVLKHGEEVSIATIREIDEKLRREYAIQKNKQR